jgi:hypothetical protein
MEETKEENAQTDTRAESKLGKIFRRILGIVFVLGMALLIYKMVLNKIG